MLAMSRGCFKEKKWSAGIARTPPWKPLCRFGKRQGQLAARVIKMNDEHLAFARIDVFLRPRVKDPPTKDNTPTAPITQFSVHRQN